MGQVVLVLGEINVALLAAGLGLPRLLLLLLLLLLVLQEFQVFHL